MDSSIAYVATRSAGLTRFDGLHVHRVRAGSTVRVRCDGGGCPYRVRTREVKRYAADVDLSRPLRHAWLRAGARVEVRVTRPEAIGMVRRLVVRRGRGPKRVDLCLPPGARLPIRCRRS